MLNSVSKEIGAHLKYYTEFEEIELEVDKWDNQIVRNSYEKILNEKDCLIIIGLLHKIQDTVKFFKANLAEYQKAEIYLRRYENLRERTLAIV
jgi:hypothetical protein